MGHVDPSETQDGTPKASSQLLDLADLPAAPGLDLPTVPIWKDRLWHRAGAVLTPAGEKFLLADGPEIDFQSEDAEASDVLGFHLVAGKPWMSWRGRLVGKMGADGRADARKAFKDIDLTKWRLEFPGHVGWFRQERYSWDDDGTDGEETCDRVPTAVYDLPRWAFHDGRRDLTWFAQNPSPTGLTALLPSYYAPLTVKLGAEAHTILRKYVQSRTDSAIYATLHTIPPKTPRGSSGCEVRVDRTPVGQLSPQATRSLAPVVEDLEERGYVPTTWAILIGNSLATKLSIYPQRSPEISQSWLKKPNPVRIGPNG